MNDAFPQFPHWRREFPIHREDEERITRRGFCCFLGAAGTCAGLASLLPERRVSAESPNDVPIEVGPNSLLEETGCATFVMPGTGAPVLLIRLPSSEIVAYDQRCSHLLCPVHYEKPANRIVCPCHHGLFSPEDGRPLAGPPKKSLRRFEVSVKADRLYLVPSGKATVAARSAPLALSESKS